MNTDISLVAELELTDVELEAVIGGRGALIGSITINNSWTPTQYGNTNTQYYQPSGQSYNSGAITTGGSTTGGSSTGYVTNAGGIFSGGNYSY